MQNPITRAREKHGLGRREFALLLGVSYNALHNHEQGLPAQVQPAILAGLERLGIDAAQVAEEYARWRKLRREELLRSVSSLQKKSRPAATGAART